MDIHIALMGKAQEPVLKGILAYPVDKLYILHSSDSKEFKYEQAAQDIRKKLITSGLNEVELVRISPFDMRDVLGSIIEIADREKSSNIFVNITGGTNLMAAAACSAAFYISAKAYYVLDQTKLPRGTSLKDQVIELPIPKVPYIRNLPKKQMDILAELSRKNGLAKSGDLRIRLRLVPQTLSYNLKILESKGFIATSRGTSRDKRELTVSLTESGRLAASWTVF